MVYAPKAAVPGTAALVAPAENPNFIRFEPIAGITNAMKLAHKGVYKELQSIPGGNWEKFLDSRPRF